MARFRIAQLAQERGLSVAEIHRRIIERATAECPEMRYITYRTVLRLYKNQTLSPEYATLEGVALAMGVTVADLYAPPGEAEPGNAQKNVEPLCV